MRFRRMAGSAARYAVLSSSLVGSAMSCSSEEVKPRGQLMLAVSTDLAITHDMNQVGVEVFDQDGVVLSAQDLDIIPAGETPMPGTLAVVPPDAGGQTVRIKITAKHQRGATQEARVVRQAIVKVPTDRVAMLRMPLHWLCDLSSKDNDTECSDQETCKAGVCVPADVDANALPAYSPGQVFGGGDEHGAGSYCLNVQKCFESAPVLKKPSPDDCSLPLPDGADPDSLNVAMVLPPKTDGHCLPDPVTGEKDGGACFMPFDNDPEDGFVIKKGRIRLPPAACRRSSVTGIAVSTECRSKDLSVPICGPWTGWPTAPATGAGGAGGEPALSSGGIASIGDAGATTGGTLGEAGALGAIATCAVSAARAPAYYYVVLDTTAEMTSLPTIRSALNQFTKESASEGVLFGLQAITSGCQVDYSQPRVDFTALPGVALPNLQPGQGNDITFDSVLGQTFNTLNQIGTPASRTLVLVTGAVDQGCFSDPDQMHQTLSDAANAGVSIHSLVIEGNDPPTNAVMTGLNQQTAPIPGANLQAQTVITALDSYRDELGPCTYVAPASASYWAELLPNGGQPTPLTRVTSAAQCTDRPSYYPRGQTFVLCPSACSQAKVGADVQTDECRASVGTGGSSGTAGAATAGTSAIAGGPGTGGTFGTAGASGNGCPASQPTNGSNCTGLLNCGYGAVSCNCNQKIWTCK